MNPAGRESVLVSTDWLDAHKADADVRIVDIRGVVLPPGAAHRYQPKRQDYEQGHIPGAVFVDWTRDIVDPADPVPMQVAQAEAFGAAMGRLGIGEHTMVVAYDDYNHIFAGRLAWALRYYGHKSVRLLDGGWKRWVAEGRAQSCEEPLPQPARFVARPQPALRRTAAEVLAGMNTGVLLVDARAPEQYSGQTSAAARSGHIPGALNVHYPRLIDAETGTFLPPEALARVFAEAGMDVDHLPAEVVVYCNGGVSCTVPLEALRLLGRSDVALYDGSWNEWGNDTARPIERDGRTR